MDFLQATTLPPDDDRRGLYTYLGRRMRGTGGGASFRPFFLYDGVRARPSLVLGGDEPGRREYLINLAVKDAGGGRSVVFLDRNFDRETLDKLYYWCGKKMGRRVLALVPQEGNDGLSHSWNPFLSQRIKIGTLTETFFNGFSATHPVRSTRKRSEMEMQREAFGLLLRALHSTGRAFNAGDVLRLLEDDEALSRLARHVRKAGAEYYADLLHLIGNQSRFHEKMGGFLDFLKLWDSWTLGSYHPDIQLGTLPQEKTVVYVGLGGGMGNEATMAVGYVMLQQLKAVLASLEANERESRRSLSVLVNDVRGFLDAKLGEWFAKARHSTLMMTWAAPRVRDLEERAEEMLPQLQGSDPFLTLFRPEDEATGEWFRDAVQRVAPMQEIEYGDCERLKEGQFMLKVPMVNRALLIAGARLPDPPMRGDCCYRRIRYSLEKTPQVKGLQAFRLQ